MSSKKILAGATLCLAVAATAAVAGVSGQATLSGTTPAETTIKMNADPKCIALYDEPVTTSFYSVDDDGGLANVFVYIKNPPEGDHPVPSSPVVLRQKGCLYAPFVSGVRVDQTLRIENNDDNLHNVRAIARENRPFNIGQPAQTPPRDKTFKLPENAIRFKCDVHPWMEAWVFAMDHPFFAITATDGSFEIDGLPAGDYILVAWHSKLGEQEQTISVGTDGSASADFTFEGGAE